LGENADRPAVTMIGRRPYYHLGSVPPAESRELKMVRDRRAA